MEKEPILFSPDKWYYFVDCDDHIVGAVNFHECTDYEYHGLKRKVKTWYYCYFKENPWSKADRVGTLTEIRHLEKFLADLIESQNMGRIMVVDSIETSELRESLWFIFSQKFMDPHTRIRVSLRARDLVGSGTPSLIRQLAAFYFVAYNEGFLEELEKWERGYHAWFHYGVCI